MSNIVAKILKIIAIIIFAVGLIFGFTQGKYIIIIWAVTFIEGILFYTFAELINQATLNNLKTDKIIELLEKLIESNQETSRVEEKNLKNVISESKIESNITSKKDSKKDYCDPIIKGEHLVCPKCGLKQEKNRTLCWDCGTNFLDQM